MLGTLASSNGVETISSGVPGNPRWAKMMEPALPAVCPIYSRGSGSALQGYRNPGSHLQGGLTSNSGVYRVPSLGATGDVDVQVPDATFG